MRKFPRWLKILGIVVAMLLIAMLAVLIGMGWYVKNQMLDSGGEISPEMAAYDVRHYDLSVGIDPETQQIDGSNTMTVEAVAKLTRFEINLDNRLEVESVFADGDLCSFRHRAGVISAELPSPWAAGERHEVAISYSGAPKVALRPPWIDGFVWSETPTGDPWIGVTGQGDGGDNWWPCKDHPSDEPDEGMDIALTVPYGLVGLTNGRFLGESENGDGTVDLALAGALPHQQLPGNCQHRALRRDRRALPGYRRDPRRDAHILVSARVRTARACDVETDASDPRGPRQALRRVPVL